MYTQIKTLKIVDIPIIQLFQGSDVLYNDEIIMRLNVTNAPTNVVWSSCGYAYRKVVCLLNLEKTENAIIYVFDVPTGAARIITLQP
jgi:hypothetical protein